MRRPQRIEPYRLLDPLAKTTRMRLAVSGRGTLATTDDAVFEIERLGECGLQWRLPFEGKAFWKSLEMINKGQSFLFD